jgi:hypothetical protein
LKQITKWALFSLCATSFFCSEKKKKPHLGGNMPPLKNNGNQARIEHDGGVSGDKKHLLALMVF